LIFRVYTSTPSFTFALALVSSAFGHSTLAPPPADAAGNDLLPACRGAGCNRR
jgi:hypothetical protein